MRLILIAAVCLVVSPANAQAWFHHTATHAVERQTARNAGKPFVPARHRAPRNNSIR